METYPQVREFHQYSTTDLVTMEHTMVRESFEEREFLAARDRMRRQHRRQHRHDAEVAAREPAAVSSRPSSRPYNSI